MLKSKMFSATIVAAFGLGLLLNNKVSSGSKSDMALKNLTALEASAGEIWCDQTNQSTCTISAGGATGKSTGVLRATTTP